MLIDLVMAAVAIIVLPLIGGYIVGARQLTYEDIRRMQDE